MRTTQPLPSAFFFNSTATTEFYTLSLHDALPIWADDDAGQRLVDGDVDAAGRRVSDRIGNRAEEGVAAGLVERDRAVLGGVVAVGAEAGVGTAEIGRAHV